MPEPECSLKTEQRKVQKRVRALPRGVFLQFRIYELDNNNPALDASQGTVTRPDPGSLTPIEGCFRALEISMESLILAQDERWRRA